MGWYLYKRAPTVPTVHVTTSIAEPAWLMARGGVQGSLSVGNLQGGLLDCNSEKQPRTIHPCSLAKRRQAHPERTIRHARQSEGCWSSAAILDGGLVVSDRLPSGVEGSNVPS